jgi:NADP-dependent 3-hydroxy acid dehydrogenase YdfG
MVALKGKSVLITGASKGIGRATALRLVREGACLALCATSADLLETLKGEIEGQGGEVLARRCDVSRLAECERMVASAIGRFGRIDVLINNAGIGYSGSVADSDPQEIAHMVQVNFLGPYYMTRTVLPHMTANRQGDIVNIASVAGLKYSPHFAMYSATKFAVRAFSEGLRNEVQQHGIRVTTVHPGMVETHFFDAFKRGGVTPPQGPGDILRAEDIAEAVLFALTRPERVAVNEMTVRPYWQER